MHNSFAAMPFRKQAAKRQFDANIALKRENIIVFWTDAAGRKWWQASRRHILQDADARVISTSALPTLSLGGDIRLLNRLWQPAHADFVAVALNEAGRFQRSHQRAFQDFKLVKCRLLMDAWLALGDSRPMAKVLPLKR